MVMMKVLVIFILTVTICMAATREAEGLEFHINEADADTYLNFINALRVELCGAQPKNKGFFMLRDESTLQGRDRVLEVQLFNYAEESITVVINVENVYVLGYAVDGRYHQFSDAPPFFGDLFPNPGVLSTKGTYSDLERQANARRGALLLGLLPLDSAITNLRYGSNIARSLLVIIQMISEAVRFGTLANHIANSIHIGTVPLPFMVDAQQNWGKLSAAICSADDESGTFSASVPITNMDGGIESITDIYSDVLIAMLSLLLNVASRPKCSLSTNDLFDEMCWEGVTGSIVGLDGKCLEASDNSPAPSLYMSRCNIMEPNQNWTFRADGAIVWKDTYCMSIQEGDVIKVVLIDCKMPDIGRWNITPERRIFERKEAWWFLTADDSDTVSALEKYGNLPGQFWSFGPEVHLTRIKIRGFEGGSCMMANLSSFSVTMDSCSDRVSDLIIQVFTYYPDRSIRPAYAHLCITVADEGYSLVIDTCKRGLNIIWYFNNDGTISGWEEDDLFMEMKVGGSVAVAERNTSTRGQTWVIEF